jgi:hypothetical protein
MRWGITFGMGLAAVLSGSALAQFPSNQPTAAPSLPAGYQPVVPARTAPATGGLPAGYSELPTGELRPLAPPPPINLEIPTAVPANHEWLLKPEHGAYFISVKSYSRPSRPTTDDQGPSALTLAEALAAEIRDQYRVQAFLFEHVSDDRRAEAAAIAAARARGQQLAAKWDTLRKQAELNGMEFLEPDNKIRFKTVNYKDQIAVLIGGFKTDEDARKALDKVRTWAPPKTKVKDRLGREVTLMDLGTIFRPGPNGKQLLQEAPINPFSTATVVPNPTIARPVDNATGTMDPFIVKLNEGRPYNLLTATKSWTLGVKSFSAPVEIVSKDANTSVMRKFGSSKGADALVAGAEQAESMAKTLREMKTSTGQSLGLEAFVLHTRTSSLVTVGQFDSPNDPELLRIRKLLGSMKVNVTEDPTGLKPVTNVPSLFGNLIPMPIPRK